MFKKTKKYLSIFVMIALVAGLMPNMSTKLSAAPSIGDGSSANTKTL